jgi:DNA processing protein
VIVEARSRSGALITVDLAMEIGRPIYAVPGEITSALSDGTNDLLRQSHAAALTSARDILGALGIGGPSR